MQLEQKCVPYDIPLRLVVLFGTIVIVMPVISKKIKIEPDSGSIYAKPSNYEPGNCRPVGNVGTQAPPPPR